MRAVLRTTYYLPFGHIFGRVALHGHGVEDEAELASLLPGSHAVQADVELGAVRGVGVLGMGVAYTEGIGGAHLRAVEPGVESALLSLAVRPRRGSGPVADTLELVEPEAGGTSVLLGHAVHAGVEHRAHRGIGVSVETVQPGTQIVGALGRFYGK